MDQSMKNSVLLFCDEFSDKSFATEFQTIPSLKFVSSNFVLNTKFRH